VPWQGLRMYGQAKKSVWKENLAFWEHIYSVSCCMQVSHGHWGNKTEQADGIQDEFDLVWFILRPCQHDDGYIDGRSQIKVHTDERTQVHSAQHRSTISIKSAMLESYSINSPPLTFHFTHFWSADVIHFKSADFFVGCFLSDLRSFGRWMQLGGWSYGRLVPSDHTHMLASQHPLQID